MQGYNRVASTQDQLSFGFRLRLVLFSSDLTFSFVFFRYFFYVASSFSYMDICCRVGEVVYVTIRLEISFDMFSMVLVFLRLLSWLVVVLRL